MTDNYGKRPGTINVGDSIGLGHTKTDVIITRLAHVTPGTENGRNIQFEKDPKFIVTITFPNDNKETYETTSVTKAREFIEKQLKNGFTTYEIGQLIENIKWDEIR